MGSTRPGAEYFTYISSFNPYNYPSAPFDRGVIQAWGDWVIPQGTALGSDALGLETRGSCSRAILLTMMPYPSTALGTELL